MNGNEQAIRAETAGDAIDSEGTEPGPERAAAPGDPLRVEFEETGQAPRALPPSYVDELRAQTPPSSYDPLLECLAIVAKLYYRPVSIEGLISGLPAEPGSDGPEMFSLSSSKGMFSRVAKRAGFASRLIQRRLDDLSDLLLPCILVNRGQSACVLEQIDREQGRAKVIFPDLDDAEQWVELDALKEEYLGYAFLLKPEYEKEHRSLRVVGHKDGHWFWGTLWRSREIYFSVIIGSILVNLFALATPLFTMNVYDRVVPNHALETLWVLAIGVGTVYIFDATMRFIRNYLLEVAGKKSDVIMSSLIFEHVMNLRMDRWPKSVGAFMHRIGQFESIRSFFTASTVATLVDLPFTILFLLVVAYIGDALVTVPMVAMSVMLLYALIIVRPLRASIDAVVAATAAKQAMLVENLNSIQTIKTLGASKFAQWSWEESVGEIAARSVKTRTLSGSIEVVTSIIVQLNMVGIVILGVYEIIDLELTMGALIAVVMLSSRAISPMAQLAGLITQYQQTKVSFASLNSLMAEPVERPEEKTFVRRPNIEGSITFKDLSFNYPEAENATLTGLNLDIKPGERVGVIGRVGSGKTTLSKLLMALYPPSSGSLTIDQIDINQIDPADLRRHVAYLPQEIELIRGTIRDNIALKDPRVGDDRILAAARIAGVDDFVNRLPRGYDTLLGEQGSGLSGGQRQAVALARTLVLNESLLILDEPTNSMDNTTESLVRERLYTYTRDKTLILVTHKAPMLDLVDRLVVIDDGRVQMDGPKDQVLGALRERARSTTADKNSAGTNEI